MNITYNYLNNINNIQFGSMKKSQFKGLDLSVINQYKAPIEKFNSYDDFDNWAKDKIEQILKSDKIKTNDHILNPIKDYKPKLVNQWIYEITGDESANKQTTPVALMILDSIFKDLKYDLDALPATFNEEAFNETLTKMKQVLNNNPKAVFNFDKIYRKNLSNIYFEEERNKQGIIASNSCPYWIKIPSLQHDREHFEENIQKLKAMSSPFWCTKEDYRAQHALEEADFYICVKNHEAKIGIRGVYDGVFDIQGRLNDFKPPYKYADIVDKKMQEENLNYSSQGPAKSAQWKAKAAYQIFKNIEDDIKNCNIKKIMEYFDMNPTELDDGSFEVSNYKGYPDFLDYFKKYGINEEKFCEKIKKVKGDLYLDSDDKNATLHNIEEVKGNVLIYGKGLKSLGKIKKIGGNLTLTSSSVEDLGDLEELGGNLQTGMSLNNLGKLKRINGNAYISNEQLKYINQLEYVANMDMLLERLNG